MSYLLTNLDGYEAKSLSTFLPLPGEKVTHRALLCLRETCYCNQRQDGQGDLKTGSETGDGQFALTAPEHTWNPYLPEENAAVATEMEGVSILLFSGVVLLQGEVHQLPLDVTFL